MVDAEMATEADLLQAQVYLSGLQQRIAEAGFEGFMTHGIGHHVGNLLDEPVLILKSCIGNRSLGWDLLPPGSESYEFEDNGTVYTYAGYKQSPLRWEKGTEPEPIGWYAGMQYDGDIANAKQVLTELDKYYPGAQGYEV